MKILLLAIFLSNFAHAQIQELRKTEVVTKEFKDPKGQELQDGLLLEALNQFMKAYVPGQGQSYEAFEKNLKTEFDEYFVLSGKLNREEEFRKFTGLESALLSHQVKSLKQTPGQPGFWTAEIDLSFDQQRLDRRMKRILAADKKVYERLLLLSEITLLDLDWKDLSLEKESHFTHPLLLSWEKFLNDHLPVEAGEAMTCSGECLSFKKTWDETSPETITQGPQSLFHRDLFVKLKFTLKKLKEKSGGRAFSWNGSMILSEVKTKRIIGSFEIPLEEKEWRGLDAKALNSALASAMYRAPLGVLSQLGSKLKTHETSTRAAKLTITGHQNLGDIHALMTLLKSRGTSLGLKVELEGMGSGAVEVLCFYQGEEKSFTDLLSQLKELKSSHSYFVTYDGQEGRHTLKLSKP